MKFIPSILLFFFLLSFSSCSTKTVEPELPDANPPAPVIPEEPIPEKEKMLWFDAEANFERFSKKENITYYLDLAKSTGFNKIVVDVRPVQGLTTKSFFGITSNWPVTGHRLHTLFRLHLVCTQSWLRVAI